MAACGDDSEGVAACGECYARGGGWNVVVPGEPVVAVTSSTWQRTGRACSDDGGRVVYCERQASGAGRHLTIVMRATSMLLSTSVRTRLHSGCCRTQRLSPWMAKRYEATRTQATPRKREGASASCSERHRARRAQRAVRLAPARAF